MNKQTITAIALPLIGAVAGYFGYQPIQEKINPPEVTVDVHVPEDTHSHPSHKHKDWLPVIKAEIEKARAKHELEDH